MKASGFVFIANFHVCLILLDQSLERGCVRRTAVRRSKKTEWDFVIAKILQLSIEDANAEFLMKAHSRSTESAVLISLSISLVKLDSPRALVNSALLVSETSGRRGGSANPELYTA